MRLLFLFAFVAISFFVNAQDYRTAIRMYRQDYITKHEVVKGADVANLQFFEVNPDFKVQGSFVKKENSPWFQMQTSGTLKKMYRVFGTATFTYAGAEYKLNVYQSQDLLNSMKNYLFLPFTDATTGKETYSSGRYVDLNITDIDNGTIMIDFNKAYNPYCAYVEGKYNCPIPPKENNLSIAVTAGEKSYAKH
jgi:uncharacterized protein